MRGTKGVGIFVLAQRQAERPISKAPIFMQSLAVKRVAGSFACMSRFFSYVLIGCVAIGWLSVNAFASVEATSIDFRQVGLSGSDEEWLECEIEIDVRRDTKDSLRKDPDFVDDLEVELLLGVETGRDQSAFEFYASRANLVSLAKGESLVRFYLPPEIVERDRIRNSVHSYVIRLFREGKLVSETVSTTLERTNVKNSFLKRIASSAPENEGVLLPQNKTPFLTLYPNSTPTFRESSPQPAVAANP